VKYWLNVGFLTPDQLVPVATAAERVGFEGISLPDHLFFPERITSHYPYSADGDISWPIDAPWPDCWVAIAAMAVAVPRLRFTTSVFIAPLRDVFALAKAVGTAVAFAPERVSCGFGAGWMREEFDVVGIDFASRGRRMDEMLDVLPKLWSGDSVEHHGEHIDFGLVVMRPAAGTIPILVGGNTAPALRRAAQHDGWIGTYDGLGATTAMLTTFHKNRADLGRSDASCEVLLTGGPGIAKDAAALDALAVDGVIVPAVALTTTPGTAEVIAAVERYADRWLS
jgi:probable F420-dependent oxidoreductase